MNTMNTKLLMGGIFLCAVTFVGAATNDLTTTLQRGLFEEEANQNLGAAILAYQSVANQFDKDRKLAATAIFRLGECYRKQGNTNDAAVQYERILREFSDQPILVTLSRQNLAALGSPLPVPAAPVLSDAARQEQKRLLEEEIKLVQKQLDAKQFSVKGGVIPANELFPIERDLLHLRRQIAALDAGLPVSITTPEATAPATSTEADEVKRVQALIKDSPDLVNAPDQTGETPLETAAAKGKLAVVKLLLDNGAAVDGLQQPGLTPSHYAAGNGHKTVVDLLLSKGAKPGAETEAGVTALHLVAQKGYESVAKALLAAGAPVDARTKDRTSLGGPLSSLKYNIGSGETPLHLAAIAGYPGMVELLLAKGAEVNAEDGEGRTPLSYATQKRYEPIVKLLLAAHAKPDAGRWSLPVLAAAYNGDTNTLGLLLAHGADPNTNSQVNWDVNGRELMQGYHYNFTPLVLAVLQRHADAVEELLRSKANPNLLDPRGSPPLYDALGDVPTMKALLDGGADPNARTYQGTPLLLQVVLDKDQRAVELLLAHQADVNCTNREGGTPLCATARMGNKPIAELLLKAGADVNTRSPGGVTALYDAVDFGHPEMVELLLTNKANPNLPIANGWTPLHAAVYRNRADIMRLLLAHNADPNLRDESGRTPLDLAKSMAQQPRPPGERVWPPPPGLPAPGLPGQPVAVSAPKQEEPKPLTMADLLREHGALDDLPHLDQIGVRRGSIVLSQALFFKGPQDWSQYTLLDLLAVEYRLLAAEPDEGGVRFLVRAYSSAIPAFPSLTWHTCTSAGPPPI